jgi:hypothetical protein
VLLHNLPFYDVSFWMHRCVAKWPRESGSCSCSCEEGGDGGRKVVLVHIRVKRVGWGNRGSGFDEEEEDGSISAFQGKKRQRRMRTIVGRPW